MKNSQYIRWIVQKWSVLNIFTIFEEMLYCSVNRILQFASRPFYKNDVDDK